MANGLFRLLAVYARTASRAVGLKPQAVSASNGTVSIEGTGIRIRWSPDALGEGRAGWEVTETCHEMNLIDDGEREETRKVVGVAAADVYGAARAALLAVAERSVDAALGEAASLL